MIYDRLVEVFQLDAAKNTLRRRLALRSAHYYASLSVYQGTYYKSVQTGESVDRMLRIPGDTFPPTGDLYAVPDDGQVYKITRAQVAEDEDGLPAVTLSLHREEDRYELFRA